MNGKNRKRIKDALIKGVATAAEWAAIELAQLSDRLTDEAEPPEDNCDCPACTLRRAFQASAEGGPQMQFVRIPLGKRRSALDDIDVTLPNINGPDDEPN